jgi:hypothetical protein
VTSHALTRPSAGVDRRIAPVALVSALAGALAILSAIGLVRLLAGQDDTAAASTYTAPHHAFSIAVPAGWTALSGAALARIPGAPAAVLRRRDGRGLVIVRRTGALRADLRVVARSLTTRLRARFAGFRLIGARLGRVRAGGAFLYTFARGPQSVAQSLALTRLGGTTYRIDTVVAGTAPDAAREAGTAVGSFGP